MIYFYPNRPLLLTPDHPKVEVWSQHSDWDAEIKKNGTRLVLQQDSGLKFFNRKRGLLKYRPAKGLIDELNSLEIPNHSQLDAELLHFKTKHIKDVVYFYDAYLLKEERVTEELQFRREILHNLFKGRKFKHIEIAQTYSGDFHNLFNEVIKKEENEGLVMKNKKGKIVWKTTRSPDVPWQVKIRKSTKNYRF